jgi:hypothetical protein
LSGKENLFYSQKCVDRITLKSYAYEAFVDLIGKSNRNRDLLKELLKQLALSATRSFSNSLFQQLALSGLRNESR